MTVKRLVHIILVLGCVGCTTEYNLATRQQETLMYSSEKEVKIGDAVAPKIEEQYGVVEDIDLNNRVDKIFKRLVAVSDRQDLVFFIKILDDDQINAISIPGGYVYLFKGLVEKTKTDDQIAGVIAHEIGHITAKHGIKRLQSGYTSMALQVAAIGSGDPDLARGTSMALTSLFLEHSQKAEFEADRLSVKYMKKAGYNPVGMAEFLKIMQDEKGKGSLRPHSYWKTHPNITQRIAVVNQENTGDLQFRDYLNLTGNE